MEYNTIRLLKGDGDCSKERDTILGKYANPEVLKTWSIDEKDQVEKEFKKYKSKLSIQRMTCCAVIFHEIVYALQYCHINEDGSIAEGSSYIFAEGNKIL